MHISIRLTEDIGRRLARLAVRTGRSKTFFVIEAVRRQIEDLEDICRAEEQAVGARNGKVKTVALATLRAQMLARAATDPFPEVAVCPRTDPGTSRR